MNGAHDIDKHGAKSYLSCIRMHTCACKSMNGTHAVDKPRAKSYISCIRIHTCVCLSMKGLLFCVNIFSLNKCCRLITIQNKHVNEQDGDNCVYMRYVRGMFVVHAVGLGVRCYFVAHFTDSAKRGCAVAEMFAAGYSKTIRYPGQSLYATRP